MSLSLSAVHGTLVSLKSCQADLLTGMDIVTSVAMDLAEDQDEGRNPGIDEMKELLLECAKLDREIDCFVDIVQQSTADITAQQPETMFGLSSKVKERFSERKARLSERDLQNHRKVVAFKDSINSCFDQDSQEPKNMEELDEDIAVTQTQANFTCPLTQEHMINPVKNKICNHHYEETAIRSLIETRKKNKKRCFCPVVGCGNMEVTLSDLVPDHTLKRQIQKEQRQGDRT
ncbi:E3 SUMO-protein ligase NSE2 isoform X1 [Entelurus aequoreus]|uniref:E3 SUMO-protein ligase NSE2 isoform X1 n=1 Tax=Entelurus aequoreus TaxID=161455 RepID=UPI002B1E0E54|nr:E3 SUMO-protein ligase NSE2 isoform X1 [Entelurus aequoreus]